VVRWRCCDLRDEIARHFGVKMHERTVGKLLARLNFSRVSVRPRHPKQDLEAQQAHKKTSPSSSAQSFPSVHEESPSSLSYEGPSFCAKQEPQTSILKCLSVVVVGSFRAWSLRTVSE